MFKDTHPYRILVIEDNPGDLLLITDYLEEHIATPIIEIAKNYKEASLLLTSPEHKTFDVIFLDLSLPDNQGENLINEVVSINANSPIIVLSGYSDFEFSIKSLSLGISDYLLKDELTPSSLYKSLIYNIERKKILSDLEEAKLRYGNLFQLSPQPMFVFDSETLMFLDVNISAIKHYGYAIEEFLSMSIREIRPKEDLQEFDEIWKVASSNNKSYNKLINRHITKNGRIIQVEIQSNYINYKGRDARIVLANDITDQMNHISTIEKQNSKLKEISWIQSHVVRAPIARLMSLVNLIKMDRDNVENHQELLDYILDSAHELDDIVRDISARAEQIHIATHTQSPDKE
ncbi:response regulator [Anditalea andensis]|uniref:Histidine kinase n=1 Tax=Anditalea andensis TaxID=1048983 RepID=A0A074LPE5_9BACT|nr:response regulator [Anditalea andensis]KEO75797.1 hypothetical protein EL17_22490 [Anditalea andensis]